MISSLSILKATATASRQVVGRRQRRSSVPHFVHSRTLFTSRPGQSQDYSGGVYEDDPVESIPGYNAPASNEHNQEYGRLEEAAHRKDLNYLVQYIRDKVDSGEQVEIEIVKATCNACILRCNLDAANALFNLLIPVQPGPAHRVLGDKARILSQLGRWDELSESLFGQRHPESKTPQLLRETVLSRALQGVATTVPATAFQIIRQELAWKKGPSVWAHQLTFMLLMRALMPVYAEIGDKSKVAALIEALFILIDILHSTNGLTGVVERYRFSAAAISHVMSILFKMGEYGWAREILQNRAQRICDPTGALPTEFNTFVGSLKDKLFDRALRDGLISVHDNHRPLPQITQLAYHLAAARFDKHATVESLFKLWDGLSMHTYRQPGNAVDAARSLAAIEWRTTGKLTLTENFILRTAPEVGFTHLTKMPLHQVLIQAYADAGDSVKALAAFREALDGLTDPAIQTIRRSLVPVLESIANDQKRRNQSREMLLEAVALASKAGNIITQPVVAAMMKIHFATGHYDDVIFLFQKYVDTIPPPPAEDGVPTLVPLIAPNAEICNLTLKALISTQSEPGRREYAMSIFDRMRRAAAAAEVNLDIAERVRNLYWSASRQIHVTDFLKELTDVLIEGKVLPPEFVNLWLPPSEQVPMNEPGSEVMNPDDDPWRLIYPQMAPNAESFQIILRAVRTPVDALLVLDALNSAPDVKLSEQDTNLLLQLLGSSPEEGDADKEPESK